MHLPSLPEEVFAARVSREYIGGIARFELTTDRRVGTNLLLTHEGIGAGTWNEVRAGWLNVLFPLKAWVVHGVTCATTTPSARGTRGMPIHEAA